MVRCPDEGGYFIIQRWIFFDLDKKPYSSHLIKVFPTLAVCFCLKITTHLLHSYKQSSLLKMYISICMRRYFFPYAKPIPVPAWLVFSMCPNYVFPTNSLSLRSQINCHFPREVFPLIRCSLPLSPLYFLKNPRVLKNCFFIFCVGLLSISPIDRELH